MCVRYCAKLFTHNNSFNLQDMPMVSITVPQNRQGFKEINLLPVIDLINHKAETQTRVTPKLIFLTTLYITS